MLNTMMTSQWALMIEQAGAPTRTVPIAHLPCRIGRGRECEVVLSGWRVGRVHAELRASMGATAMTRSANAFNSSSVVSGTGAPGASGASNGSDKPIAFGAPMSGTAWLLVDSGTLSGTLVNGERVRQSAPLSTADVIELAGYRLRLVSQPGWAAAGLAPPEAAQCVSAPIAITQPADGIVEQASGAHAYARAHAFEEPLDSPNGASPSPEPVKPSGISESSSQGLKDAAQRMRGSVHAAESLAWRRRIHREVLGALDLRRRDLQHNNADALRSEIKLIIEDLLSTSLQLPQHLDRAQIIAEVLDEAVGLGPLERLLEDGSISEIMVNAPDDIWIERAGRLERHAGGFSDADAVRSVIDRIVAPLGRRIDESSPMVDARLPDGSRVNAVIPPLALRGPALTIRRFSRKLVGPEDLMAVGAASAAMLAFLTVCVERRRNIIISGGTSSGKTTLLNVLSNLIPEGERIVTIEDAAELSLRHAHLVQLEGRPGNLEQRGEVTIRDLVRNALRMRPDRIVVGECRGGETLDMLQAMNTGHDGSLTTIHANSPRDVVSRLEVMTLMAGMELPVLAIREQIAAAVDVVVHQARFADGSRRITSIMEVTGMESGRVQMQPLFEFRAALGQRGGAVRGSFDACNTVPTFYEGLREAGVALDLSLFVPAVPTDVGNAHEVR
jgi:pilus assembly protein CpaF